VARLPLEALPEVETGRKELLALALALALNQLVAQQGLRDLLPPEVEERDTAEVDEEGSRASLLQLVAQRNHAQRALVLEELEQERALLEELALERPEYQVLPKRLVPLLVENTVALAATLGPAPKWLLPPTLNRPMLPTPHLPSCLPTQPTNLSPLHLPTSQAGMLPSPSSPPTPLPLVLVKRVRCRSSLSAIYRPLSSLERSPLVLALMAST
jgi:hypothetical protein